MVVLIVNVRLSDPRDPWRRRLSATVDIGSSAFDVSNIGILRSSGPTVYMAQSDPDWGEMVDAENRKSAELMDRLLDLHRVAKASTGTRVVVVRVGNDGWYVLLLDGKDRGVEETKELATHLGCALCESRGDQPSGRAHSGLARLPNQLA